MTRNRPRDGRATPARGTLLFRLMSGRTLRTLALATLLTAVVACGNESPSPSAGASGSGPGPEGSGGPAASGAAPTPSFEGDLPAGIQFGAPQSLPGGFGGLYAESGGDFQFFGMQGGAPARAVANGSSWQVSTINPGAAYSPPPGFAFQGGAAVFRPSRAAAGPSGTVVAGVAFGASSTQSGSSAVPMSVLWFSADGSSWRQVDPRDIAGGAATSVLITDVVAVGDGFMASGSAGPATGAQPPAAVVFSSPDGVSWTQVGSFGSSWAMSARSIFPGDGLVLVSGAEYPCLVTPSAPYQGSLGSIRLWVSEDDGGTWDEVDPAGAEPVLHTPEAPPSSAANCPAATDVQAMQQRFQTTGEVIGLGDDRIVAISEDGSQTAVTEDLESWAVTEVPGAVASTGAGGTTPSESAATLLTADDSGWTLRQVKPRRDTEGTELSAGCQVFWWQTTDAGAHWYPGPMARPLRVCDGGFYALHALSTDEVIYILGAAPVTPNPISAFAVSGSGPLQDWTTCTPAAGAACAFAVIDSPSGSNLDWSGIDLFGATVTNAQLDGLNLVGANVAGVTLDGSFRGANLSGAFLTHATLGGDFTAASFSGAYVDNAIFEPGTTCPDGQPATSGAGGAACRLE